MIANVYIERGNYPYIYRVEYPGLTYPAVVAEYSMLAAVVAAISGRKLRVDKCVGPNSFELVACAHPCTLLLNPDDPRLDTVLSAGYERGDFGLDHLAKRLRKTNMFLMSGTGLIFDREYFESFAEAV